MVTHSTAEQTEPAMTDPPIREQDIERASRALRAIAHPIRLKILCMLNDREASVQEIVELIGTSQSNISQHLTLLRDKDVLISRRDANRVFYRVGDIRTLKLIGLMEDVFCQTPFSQETPITTPLPK